MPRFRLQSSECPAMLHSPINGAGMRVSMRKAARLTRPITLSILLSGLLCCGACEDYQRVKQVESYAHLQAASLIIKELIIQEGLIEQKRANEIIQRVNGGRDAWGNEIQYKQQESPHFSFILVSPGRDNALDTEKIEDYFTHPEEDIRGKPDRDIVFRDALPVTFSGK